ncbi:MAG: HD family hydrolase [Candidatus Verstraetearchaeota archaeon]|nr:HD family hydrolase [Candidatus Verstraetearchaeota archaeon]
MGFEKLAKAAAVLKNVPRTGWIQRGVPRGEAETVAEHTFMVTAILGYISTSSREPHLNRERMILMGIIHDIGEAVSGDIPRGLTERLGKKLKEGIETEIIKGIFDDPDDGSLAELFLEYLERETTEAKVVKIADLLATLWQAEAYLKRGFPVGDIIESCKEEAQGMIEEIREEDLSLLLKAILGSKGR